jgi:hypothetical protein
VGRLDELDELLERPEAVVDVVVVRDVVAVVPEGARIERADPDAVRAERLDVIEAVEESSDVAVRVGERLHVERVDDGVPVPPRSDGRFVGHGRREPGREQVPFEAREALVPRNDERGAKRIRESRGAV